MAGMAFLANLGGLFFKIFQGTIPPDPPTNFFLALRDSNLSNTYICGIVHFPRIITVLAQATYVPNTKFIGPQIAEL